MRSECRDRAGHRGHRVGGAVAGGWQWCCPRVLQREERCRGVERQWELSVDCEHADHLERPRCTRTARCARSEWTRRPWPLNEETTGQLYANSVTVGTGCVAVASPPSGKALVLTHIHVATDNPSAGASAKFFEDSSCATNLVGATHVAISSPDDLVYQPGLGLAPGMTLYALGDGNGFWASASGYIASS
jgi:hypothetical protein